MFEGEKTETTFKAPGKYEENECSIAFNEKISPDPGAPAVFTKIYIGDETKVFRNDKLQFVFKKDGEETVSMYETIAGVLELRVKTNKLDWQFTETGGALYMEYDLSYDESSVSKCVYGITFEYSKR